MSHIFMSYTWCSLNIVAFFPIHCNKGTFIFTPTHTLHVREKLIPTRDLSVQSFFFAGHSLYNQQPHLISWPFLYNQQQPSAGEVEVVKYITFFERKKTIFNEHPVFASHNISDHNQSSQRRDNDIIVILNHEYNRIEK